MGLKYYSYFQEKKWKRYDYGQRNLEMRERDEIREFIQQAYEKGQRDTHPSYSPLFSTIRHLQVRPEFRNAKWEYAAGAVEFWLVSKRTDWTVFPGIISEQDAYAEFEDVWSEIRILPDLGIIEQAAERAKDCPFPRNRTSRKHEGYVHFLGLAAHLQMLRGDQVILLPCRYTGRVLGVSHETVSRYIRWAQAERLLVPVKKYKTGVRLASEYRFDLKAIGWRE